MNYIIPTEDMNSEEIAFFEQFLQRAKECRSIDIRYMIHGEVKYVAADFLKHARKE